MNKAVEPGQNSDAPARVAVIVAHPDDESLWAGGLLLSHPEWATFVLALCRRDDPDRAPRFRKALACLGARGAMADLEDGPGQAPLAPERVQEAIRTGLPDQTFDILLTHAPQGEYTWHRRHGEVSLAVGKLWRAGLLRAGELWQFAYEDGGGAYAPQARHDTSLRLPLSDAVWARKCEIITGVYGFASSSWEARAAGRTEAFDCFREGAPDHWQGGLEREAGR